MMPLMSADKTVSSPVGGATRPPIIWRRSSRRKPRSTPTPRRHRPALARALRACDGDREIAVLEGKRWGRRPVVIAVDDSIAIEPGLLLFASFVVCSLAEEASGAAGASAGAAASGG